MEIFVDVINDNVRISIHCDWLFVVKKTREFITKPPQTVLSATNYNFGKERVSLNPQSYELFQMYYFIRFGIFGKDFSKIKKCELYQSKIVVISQILSINRVRKLFCIDVLSGVTFQDKSLKYSAYPKAFV